LSPFFRSKHHQRDFNQTSAAKIKELRMKIGLKSYYCALQLDIAKSNCSKSENGKEEITLRRISQIADRKMAKKK